MPFQLVGSDVQYNVAADPEAVLYKMDIARAGAHPIMKINSGREESAMRLADLIKAFRAEMETLKP